MTIWPCIGLVRVASCTRDRSCLGHGHSAAPAPSYPDPRIVSSLQEEHRKFHWGLYWRLSGQVYHSAGQQHRRHCSAPEAQRCPPRRAKEETLRYIVVLCLFFIPRLSFYRMCRYIHPNASCSVVWYAYKSDANLIAYQDRIFGYIVSYLPLWCTDLSSVGRASDCNWLVHLNVACSNQAGRIKNLESSIFLISLFK